MINRVFLVLITNSAADADIVYVCQSDVFYHFYQSKYIKRQSLNVF